MSTTSRVPLLVGSKGRKPSRLPIAPRARPSNVDRVKRPANEEGSLEPEADIKATTTGTQAPLSPERKALPPVLPVAIAVATPVVMQVAAPVAVAVAVPRSTGGISPGHAISTPRLGTFARPQTLSNSAAAVGGVRLSPKRSPTDGNAAARSPAQTVERLSKISSKVPLFRAQEQQPRAHASPILGPRATAIPAPHGPPTDQQEHNALLKRLTRKLDIKPHQSPRRAALNHHAQSHAPSLGASPLLLSALASTGHEMPHVSLATDQNVPKKRGTKRRNPESAQVTTPKMAAAVTKKKPLASPTRRSIRRKVKKDDSYTDPADADDDKKRHFGDDEEEDAYEQEQDDEDEDDEGDDESADDHTEKLELPQREKPPVFMPARERATLWAKKVLRQQEAVENGDVLDEVVKKERRKRSNSASSVTSLATNATSVTSRKSKTEELLKKETSQMTMGELAMSIPKGRRMLRHEQEENVDHHNGQSQSHRIRSLSMSSETPSFGGGSIVTPQVEIIDGKMVILEATVKLSDDQNSTDIIDDSARRPRGMRYLAANTTPGRRWSKDETKQFYYCLSQVGPNFSMMATLFPTRKRKELKCKFKYEEKHHPGLIEIALQASAAPLDSEIVDVISQMADKETKKKEAKKRRKQSDVSMDDGLHSPATVASSVTAPSSPPLDDETMDFDDEQFTEFYRERKSSFDFAG